MSQSDEARLRGAAPEQPGPEDVEAEEAWAAVGEADADDAIDAEVVEDAVDAGAGGDVADVVDVPTDPVSVALRERDEYLQALQRTQADFENYRKRITRQQQEQAARASSDIVQKLLPVLDTLDLALAHATTAADSGDGEDAKALVATRSMLLDLLAKEGLERVDKSEVSFDPSEHDAVARVADLDETGEMMVDEVLRAGYRWKGQVLRPAMVRVRG